MGETDGVQEMGGIRRMGVALSSSTFFLLCSVVTLTLTLT